MIMEEEEEKNDSDTPIFQIITNMMIKKEGENYLLAIGSNSTRDFVIIFIQKSSTIYAAQYYLNYFKNINFFNKYVNYGLNKCIEIMVDMFHNKKDDILIEEEEDKQIKIGFEIEVYLNGINSIYKKEKIEFCLPHDNVDQIVKNYLIWFNVLYLIEEKEENKKINIEQEKKIKELTKKISDLKGMIEELKGIKINNNYIKENNLNIKDKEENSNYDNYCNNCQIINKYTIESFDFIKNKIKSILNKRKIGFKMIYNGKIHGDSSLKFHELCDNHNNTLVVVVTSPNNIFGGFASKTWNSMELGRKTDDKSFIFSYNKKKIYNPILDNNPQCHRYHLYCSENDGPCFYAFSIENCYFKNGGYCDEITKCNYDSFESDYEINNGQKKIIVKQLEVYEIIF